jgi:hypothetical protein
VRIQDIVIYPTVKMSSYRPPYRRNVWPDREAEKREAARKAEEEQKRRMEMNTTNFPELSTARPVNQRESLDGNRFAQLAQKWAVDDEVDRRMAEYKKFQEAADRRDTEMILSRRTRTRYERHDDQQDEEELAPEPQAPTTNLGIEDDIGWTEVKRKTRKPKRELTIDELDARERLRAEEEKREDEFNGHLFESNRHDHDRV